MIKKGAVFPDFELLNENGELTRLEQLLENGPAVLFFYPKDNTSGCTKEACEFRDSYAQFNQLNAKVVGISNDSQKSHKKFKDRHQLNFPLLTDKNGSLRKKAGIQASFFGLIPGRVTFIIGKNGIIEGITNSQLEVTAHIKNAIKTLKRIT
ncbi:MAG: peroxiredoxin [Salibacteraceae bacterium]|nr:peroxiredoxin [Salibacteraceae bacterium]|tara:strand:+ start:119774 stop:120229 length:456 start_codon:yes stop_codon:yes gene_type:complete